MIIQKHFSKRISVTEMETMSSNFNYTQKKTKENIFIEEKVIIRLKAGVHLKAVF